MVKGETSADGYWNMRDKSRKTFEGEWTRTGDKYIKRILGFEESSLAILDTEKIARKVKRRIDDQKVINRSESENSDEKKLFEYDFADLAIKNRTSKGNLVTKYPIFRVYHKEIGESTLGGRKIWIDMTIGKINLDGQGDFLGSFNTDELILVLYVDGTYELNPIDFSKRYSMKEIIFIEKSHDDIEDMLDEASALDK